MLLHTDESDYGVGSYLFQVVQGAEHPIIMFLSSTFKREQMIWSAADKKFILAMAILHYEQAIKSILAELSSGNFNARV